MTSDKAMRNVANIDEVERAIHHRRQPSRAKVEDQPRRRREAAIAGADRHGRVGDHDRAARVRQRECILLGQQLRQAIRAHRVFVWMISMFSSIGPRTSRLVKMLSVLVWSTRSAPAARAASSTLIVPR